MRLPLFFPKTGTVAELNVHPDALKKILEERG